MLSLVGTKRARGYIMQACLDAHITVVDGIEPASIKSWGKHAGKEIKLSVCHNVRQTGDTTGWDRPSNYWFVDVSSLALSNVMVELGFPKKEKFHLTVG